MLQIQKNENECFVNDNCMRRHIQNTDTASISQQRNLKPWKFPQIIKGLGGRDNSSDTATAFLYLCYVMDAVLSALVPYARSPN